MSHICSVFIVANERERERARVLMNLKYGLAIKVFIKLKEESS